MPHEDFARGLGFDNEISARPNVVRHSLLLLTPIDADHEPKVQVGSGSWRDYIRGVGSGLAGSKSVDVQRGLVDQVEKMFAGSIDMPEPKRAHEHLIVDRGSGQGFVFSFREGSNSIIEVRDQNMALFILHTS